nr:glycoprotein precursor [Bogoria virus]
MILVLVFLLTPCVLGFTRIYSDSSSGVSETCFSSSTTFTWAVRQWMSEMTRLPHTEKFCLLNSEEKAKHMTDEEAVGMIETLVGLKKPANFSCTDIKNSFILGLEVKPQVESHRSSSIDCKDFTMIRPLSEMKPEDLKPIATSKDDAKNLEKLEEELKKLKAFNDKTLAENLKLATSLDHELTKSRMSMDDVRKTVSELEKIKDEMAIKREEISEVQRQLKAEKEASQRYQQEIDNLKAIHQRRTNELRTNSSVLSTTIKAITVLSVLSSASAEFPNTINDYPHYMNRPGTSKFNTPEITDSTCSKLDYGINCKGFQVMFDSPSFGFFQAHYHKFSVLEALADGILTKDSSYCNVNTGTDLRVPCTPESSNIHFDCPKGFRGVNFLAADGKVSGFTCSSGHEVSEDCRTCVKSESGTTAASSITAQDVVCQDDSSEAPTFKLVPKDYCFIGKSNYKSCQQYNLKIEKIPFVVFKTGNKKYLDKLITRSVEIKSPSNFICYRQKGKINDSSSGSGLGSVRVTECKAVDSSKSTKCSGDAVFCSLYTCSRDNSDAYCIVAKGAGIIEVKYGGAWVKPKCIGYETVRVGKILKQSQRLAMQNCDTCFSECQEDGILVRSTGFKMTSIVACAHGVCVTKTQSPSTSALVPYPGMMASIGGPIGLNIAHDDDLISDHLVVHCPPRDPCKVHDCLVCPHSLINYQCHTIASSIIVVSTLSAITFFVVIVLYRILQYLKVIPKHFLQPVKWVYMVCAWCGKKIGRATIERARAVNREIGWRADDNEIRGIELQRVRPIPRYSMYMALLLVLMPCVLCCSDTEIASSKISKCRIDGSKEICKVQGTVLVKAGSIGSETCLIVKAPGELKKKFLSIKTLSSELVCLEGQSYWTAHFSPRCMSSRRCRGVAECHDHECQKWNSTMMSKEFNGVKDNEVMTENTCIEQCGGIGCGCFSVYPSCLFVHTYFKAVSREAFRVFNCIDWSHRITFEVTDFKGQKEQITLTNLNTKFTEWGSLSLTIDSESITGTNSISFMKSTDGTFAMVDEEFSDIPRPGFLGEIRCSSEVAASTAHASCLRAPGLIKYKAMTDQVDCTSDLVNPTNIFTRGSLPQSRQGKTFTATKDKESVQALTNAVIHAAVSITLDDYDIEFQSIVPTCSASFLNISGCYSCTPGASVCLKIKMSTAGVFTAITSDNSRSILINADASSKDYCRIMHFNTPDVDIQMLYACGGEEKLLEVKGTLIAVPPHDDRESVIGGSTIINPKGADWSVSNWFFGLMKWMGGPLQFVLKMVGLVLISIVLISLLLFMTKLLLRRALALRISKMK